MPGLAAGPAGAVVRTAQAMAVDQVTAEVVTALQRQGIRPILLKGPAIATWLYPEGGRSYGDTDLLVAPGDVGPAEAALAKLGFRQPSVRRVPLPARTYYRHDPGVGKPFAVDLHHTLRYVRASPETVWDALNATTATLAVAGVSVAILDAPGRAFHVALHAAQHGVGLPKPLEDLRRALATVELTQWQEAVRLARLLDAEDCLAAGLRLRPEGRALAEQLQLTDDIRVAVRLASATSGGARTLQDLAEAPSFGARVAIARDAFVPSAPAMRQLSPLARRGRAGLALSYAVRPWQLAGRLPRGGRAWLRARRPR